MLSLVSLLIRTYIHTHVYACIHTIKFTQAYQIINRYVYIMYIVLSIAFLCLWDFFLVCIFLFMIDCHNRHGIAVFLSASGAFPSFWGIFLLSILFCLLFRLKQCRHQVTFNVLHFVLFLYNMKFVHFPLLPVDW